MATKINVIKNGYQLVVVHELQKNDIIGISGTREDWSEEKKTDYQVMRRYRKRIKSHEWIYRLDLRNNDGGDVFTLEENIPKGCFFWKKR